MIILLKLSYFLWWLRWWCLFTICSIWPLSFFVVILQLIFYYLHFSNSYSSKELPAKRLSGPKWVSRENSYLACSIMALSCLFISYEWKSFKTVINVSLVKFLTQTWKVLAYTWIYLFRNYPWNSNITVKLYSSNSILKYFIRYKLFSVMLRGLLRWDMKIILKNKSNKI